jgi:hypothetical protein
MSDVIQSLERNDGEYLVIVKDGGRGKKRPDRRRLGGPYEAAGN